MSEKIISVIIRAIGENPTKEELQDFINMIDKDATGIIKFPDFLFMMASKVFAMTKWLMVPYFDPT